MGSKWGAIPENDELTTTLVQFAKEHFEGKWAVSITIYDQIRPTGWALARRLLRHYGLPPNADGWAALTKRLTGLSVVSPEESLRRNARLRWEKEWSVRVQALDEPVESMGASEWRQAVNATREIALIPRWRPVKEWDPRSRSYEVIGKQLVYEVR